MRVHCSAGTYLRSIAHDAGQTLGCGAYLKDLRGSRRAILRSNPRARWSSWRRWRTKDGWRRRWCRPRSFCPNFPAEMVDAITAGQIRNGRDFRVSPFRPQTGARFVKAVNAEGDLIAIGEARLPHLYHPVLVL